MAGDELTDRLRATFLLELHEQLRELNAALLQLEQRPRDPELIRTLFRAAHTIKGSARVVGAPLIEAACHAMESVFAELRDDRRTLAGPEFSLLFAVFDALAQAGEALRTASPTAAGDDDVATAALQSLVPRLTQLARAGVEERKSTRRRAPAAAPAPGGGPAPEARQPSEPVVEEPVRVRAERLDHLMAAVGELLIAAGRIVEGSGADDPAALRLDRAVDDVAAVARRLRMRPFADACEALPRVVRDAATSAGKQVELELRGQSVEADRLVVDALREPLLHLVRNAVAHGIETPDERQRRGKPPAGRVGVDADMRGSRLVVTVSDDGAGIDEEAVRAVFAAQNRAIRPGRAGVTDALLRGGFSTRRQADRIAGRGVGIDVVRSSIERIGGTIDVDWQPGGGTTFRLECPPTPATIRALLVRLGPHLFALPTAQVEGLRRLEAGAVRDVEGMKVVASDRGPLAVHSLAALLGPPLEAGPIEGAAPLVTIAAGARRAGLVIDEAIAEDEIVVRPLDVGEGLVPHAAGAAILPSGRLALVLNAASLISAGLRLGTSIAPAFAEPRARPPQRILVADDSITTRTLEQSVLEAAGYSVRTAVDGEDAWRQLEQDGADLVVADIEMPRMDGFALCRRIRGSTRFADLPVVLVTGLSSEADRARGLEAGADAYIVKSSFDQAGLLDTVRQLIGST